MTRHTLEQALEVFERKKIEIFAKFKAGDQKVKVAWFPPARMTASPIPCDAVILDYVYSFHQFRGGRAVVSWQDYVIWQSGD